MKELTQALDRREEPLTLFFRDDDAGWDMPALDALLEILAEADCPIDLAAIPGGLDQPSANRLDTWRKVHPGIGIHQHGFTHIDHEPEGRRKCEFGPARPVEAQCRDIAEGREMLAALLGETDPIFTPPWNRCESETVSRLASLGFAAFSSDRIVAGTAELAQIPVAFDWDRQRREGRLEPALAEALAAASAPFGVMFHHATLDMCELARIREFLAVLSVHQSVRCVSMRSLIPEVPQCTS